MFGGELISRDFRLVVIVSSRDDWNYTGLKITKNLRKVHPEVAFVHQRSICTVHQKVTKTGACFKFPLIYNRVVAFKVWPLKRTTTVICTVALSKTDHTENITCFMQRFGSPLSDWLIHSTRLVCTVSSASNSNNELVVNRLLALVYDVRQYLSFMVTSLGDHSIWQSLHWAVTLLGGYTIR